MTNDQVIARFVEFAKQEPAIRLVLLNGSLANPTVAHDAYQDVDVTCVSTDFDWLETSDWTSRFGEVLIMQTPSTPDSTRQYVQLVQFRDGHRIDLTVCLLEDFPRRPWDSLSRIIYDEIGLTDVPEASDRDYRVMAPSEAEYEACWNEFWWVSLYVVKGVKRRQLLYAMDHLTIMRDMLRQMMRWNIGYATSFQVNLGKADDGMRTHLPDELWELFGKTYPAFELSAIEDALDRMMSLFFFCAQRVAEQGAFVFQDDEARRVRAACASIWSTDD